MINSSATWKLFTQIPWKATSESVVCSHQPMKARLYFRKSESLAHTHVMPNENYRASLLLLKMLLNTRWTTVAMGLLLDSNSKMIWIIL